MYDVYPKWQILSPFSIPKFSPFWRPFYPRFRYLFFSRFRYPFFFSIQVPFNPVSNTLLSLFPINFFIPVSDTLFIPVSDTLFISVSDTLLSPFQIPLVSPFLYLPFPCHFYPCPRCSHTRNVLCPVPNVRIGHHSD